MFEHDLIINEADLIGQVIWHNDRLFCHGICELLEYDFIRENWDKKANLLPKYWNGDKNVFSTCKFKNQLIFKDTESGSICSFDIDTYQVKEWNSENGKGGLSAIADREQLYIFPAKDDGDLLMFDKYLGGVEHSGKWNEDIREYIEKKGFSFKGIRSKCAALYEGNFYFVIKTNADDLILEVKSDGFLPIRTIKVDGKGFYRSLTIYNGSLWICDTGDNEKNTLLKVDIGSDGRQEKIISVKKEKGQVHWIFNKNEIRTFTDLENGASFQDFYVEDVNCGAIFSCNGRLVKFDGNEMRPTNICIGGSKPLEIFLKNL